MQHPADRALIERIAGGGPEAWEAFVAACSDTLLRVVRLFAETYDERMDLYLFVCAKLRENDMRRLRAFRYRTEAPCRFSTWLSVVVRNLAIDQTRSQEGRFRPFRSVASLDGIDRWVFDYHFRDGVPLPEVRRRLEREHGKAPDEEAIAESAGRLRRRLSPSQRWRLLVRLAEKRGALPLDPVVEIAADDRGDPERDLRLHEAGLALRGAMDTVSPRERLALALRYRDGLTPDEAALVLAVPAGEVERLSREGLKRLRETLQGSGFGAPDFEPTTLGALWPEEAA